MSKLILLVVSVALAFPADSFSQTTQPTSDQEQQTQQPEWIEQGIFKQGPDEFVTIHTEPFPDRLDADEAIAKAALAAYCRRVADWSHHTTDDYSDVTSRLGVKTEDVLRNHLYDNRRVVLPYHDAKTDEVIARTGTPEFYRGYAQLRFTEQQRLEILHRYENQDSMQQTKKVALFGGGAFGLLAIAFAYLRLNQATRGVYSRRLQVFCVIALIALFAICITVYQQL